MDNCLIQIDQPDRSLLENTMTEQECDELIHHITEAVENENTKKYLLTEANLSDDQIKILVGGGAAITLLITSLIKWIKNKYRLTISKIYDQSKELNDLYTKVNDLLKNDKMARFKHRNDAVNCTIKYLVLHDKKDPRKYYNPCIDFLAYNAEYFIKEITSMMDYVSTQEKSNRTNTLESMKDALLERISNDFNTNHSYIIDTEPLLKVEEYHNIKLEQALTLYKKYIGNIYTIIYIINKYVGAELQYLQLMQDAYQKMLNKFGDTKDNKKIIDDIFKYLIKNMTMSMDYNSSCVKLLDEEIKHYVNALEELYNYIRS